MKLFNKTKLPLKKNEIGNNIKTYRLQAKLSQEAFAEKVYSTKSTISKWESGGITPSIDMLKIIAKSLGVSLYAILGEKQPVSNKIFNWLGKALLWGFVWIHIDVTFVWTITALGSLLMLSGALAGIGGFAAHLTGMIMHDNANSMRFAILFGYIIWMPIFFAFFSGIGLCLYIVGRQTFVFSMRFFWRNKKANFKIKEISFLNKFNKRALIVFGITIIIGLIYLIVLCSIDGTQNNWNNFKINF